MGKVWRKRKRGSPNQIGKSFPLEPHGDKSKLPKNVRQVEEIAPLQKPKGWTIEYFYKDGTKEKIPVIAKDYREAVEKADKLRNQNMANIDRIRIVDPTVSEVMHKMRESSGHFKGVPTAVTAIAPLVKDQVMPPHEYVTLTPEAAKAFGIEPFDKFGGGANIKPKGVI